MTNAKPLAPADRTNLKTWTKEQLTYAAPFWVAKLKAGQLSDLALIECTQAQTQPWLDAHKIKSKHDQQLTYWQLILSDKIYRVFPHSLRTHHRSGSAATHRGTAARRHSIVGDWDKTLGLWG